MNKPGHNGESRREFLRGGARYALLSALGAVSAALVQRSGGKLAGQTCINQGICRGCETFADCGLPSALSAKHQRSRNSPTDEKSQPISFGKPPSAGTFHPLASPLARRNKQA